MYRVNAVEDARREVDFPVISCGCILRGITAKCRERKSYPMAQHFGLSERDKDIVLGGWMALAFFILGAPMSVLINVLARDMNRRSLLLSLSVAAAASALVSAGAQHVWHLVAARAALGAATSALQPLMACVLGDLYPRRSAPRWPATSASLLEEGQLLARFLRVGPDQWASGHLERASAHVLLCHRVHCSADHCSRRLAMYLSCHCGGWGGWNARGCPLCALSSESASLSARGARRVHERRRQMAAPEGPLVEGCGGYAGTRASAEERPRHPLRRTGLHAGARVLGSVRGQMCKERRELASTPVPLCQAIFGTIPWAVLSVFLSDFLAHDKVRAHAVPPQPPHAARAPPPSSSGHAQPYGGPASPPLWPGGGRGGLCGGHGGSWLYRTAGPAWTVVATGAAQVAAAGPVLWLILAPRPDSAAALGAACVAAAAGGACSGLAGPNIKALLLNTTPPP